MWAICGSVGAAPCARAAPLTMQIAAIVLIRTSMIIFLPCYWTLEWRQGHCHVHVSLVNSPVRSKPDGRLSSSLPRRWRNPSTACRVAGIAGTIVSRRPPCRASSSATFDLQEVYDLTPAEAEVAVLRRHGLQYVADELRVSLSHGNARLLVKPRTCLKVRRRAAARRSQRPADASPTSPRSRRDRPRALPGPSVIVTMVPVITISRAVLMPPMAMVTR